MPNSLWPHGLQPTRLLCPGDFPGKDTGVGCHFLLQGIFPTHGLNLGLPDCRQILYWLSYQGSCSICREVSQARLSNFTFTFHFPALEKEMTTHSSVLAWRIPGMREPGGLPSMGSQSRTRLKRLSSSSICSPGIINKILPLLFSHPSFSIQIFLFACVFILIVF